MPSHHCVPCQGGWRRYSSNAEVETRERCILSFDNMLRLRHSAMNDLAIRTEIKHEVYSSAEQVSGPLVQRVSKHVFAVRCLPGPRHPLGYLHICFMEQKTRDGGSEHRFFCSCDTFRGEGGGADGTGCLPQWTAMDREREPEWLLRRCFI